MNNIFIFANYYIINFELLYNKNIDLEDIYYYNILN